MHSVLLVAVVFLLAHRPVASQSNYANQGNSVEFDSNNLGLPEQATLDGKVTKLDDLSPVIFLNRTKAVLNCAAGSMQADLKFNEPFFGIVYADFDRSSACRVAGKGTLTAKIELPLKGCGTRQDPQRVFTNNIVVRFSPVLEVDGDEVITIVCRYPPPIAPPPVVTARIQSPEVPAPLPPPLQGFQILLIICAILFLSLLLLGLGCSYYCLRRRHIQVVRRVPFIADTESESSKLSNPSLGPVSLFEGLKIPRAHTAPSLTSSEVHLVSEPSLPSDYPSESPSSAHSEVEEVETRSLRRPSTLSSGSESKFDVQVRLKRSPPPVPSPPGSDLEAEMTLQEQKLTTILEQREDSRSLASVDSSSPAGQTSFTYVPELHSPPTKYAATPPVYSRIVRRQQVVRMVQPPPRRPSLSTLTTEQTDLRNITDTLETTSTKRVAMLPEEPIVPVVPERKPEITSHLVDDVFLRTITEKKTFEDIERHRRQIKELHAKAQPPNPKWDVVIRNYPAPGQDLLQEPSTDWESYSETSSASGYPTTPVMERPLDRHLTERRLAQQQHTADVHMNATHLSQSHLSEHHHTSLDISRTYRSSLTIPPPEPAPPNWDVLIRVLDQPMPPEPRDGDDLSTSEIAEDVTLTTEDKEKWRQILTTESTLRTMLTEATVKEDYERIRRDQRYEQLFEPAKWDVIIRVLTPPERMYDPKGGPANQQRYRRKTDWDTRSRRSSLPTLYEYDSDGTSSARTLTTDIAGANALDLARSRRTSRSSMRSDMDVRSMTEVMVDYSRPDRADTLSDASSYYRGVPRRFYDEDDMVHIASEEDDYGPLGLARSLSQPSLARSASEFTEHWAVVRGQSPTSPRSSARSTRSSRGPAPLPPVQPLRSTGMFSEQSTSMRQDGGLVSSGATTRYVTASQTTYQQQGWFGDDNRSDDGFK